MAKKPSSVVPFVHATAMKNFHHEIAFPDIAEAIPA
jgi:hypothetical protein